ncbi:MAG: 4-hydroxy-tetrahydrodipicolinate reductase [Clostridiales Family XIII bacterium]|jgi:4-hydroxy-tetrahydrodipicolinate reductase|nr:4-hydroxy-tetrahydrodipicolinate reductase [Clostridiales Family XIII bacterium]
MRIVVSGFLGRMGRVLCEAIAEADDLVLVAGFDVEDGESGGVPVFSASRLSEAPDADVVIDFSSYVFTPDLLSWCLQTTTPVVLATTALGEKELALVQESAEAVPVFRSANMSIGIALLAKAAKLMTPPLEDGFDIEIVEAHHNQKKDAPSGTAILLADAIKAASAKERDYCYGREGKDVLRSSSEIGIHAVRAGTIPGTHEILFAGPDEVIGLKHTVYSRRVFATGALKAARFLHGKPPGLYSMDDLIEGYGILI